MKNLMFLFVAPILFIFYRKWKIKDRLEDIEVSTVPIVDYSYERCPSCSSDNSYYDVLENKYICSDCDEEWTGKEDL